MLTRLERFEHSLGPQLTLDGIDREVDATLNRLALSRAIVESATELRTVLLDVWRDFHGHIWGCNASLPVIDAGREWEWCRDILDAAYGKPDGWRTALDLASTGIQAGLYGVAVRFVRKSAEQYLDRLIQTGVKVLWQSLSCVEQQAMIKEYLQKYGSYLPPSLAQASFTELWVHFPRMLTEHPRLLQRMSRFGREA